MRLTPGSGLSFFIDGLRPLADTVTPPWAALATRPTSIRPTARGSAVLRNADSAVPISVVTVLVVGRVNTAPPLMNSSWVAVNAFCTVIGTSTLAAATTSHAPSSGVRGIWPSLRAFFRRCGVGFSVFSPPGPSAAICSPSLQGDHGAGPRLDEGVQRRGQQREGEAE